jgi:signal transduction histidine kinase
VIKLVINSALVVWGGVVGVLGVGAAVAPLAPQPTVAEVAALVASTRIPGAEIELDDRLDGEVPAAVGAATYRIVQEALTNVARHGADVTRVVVRLARTADGIRVEVHDDGSVAHVEPGRGLLGMRERVELLGGTFEIAHDGGFLVTAALPTERDEA